MLGVKLDDLREKKGMVQRQIAAKLENDEKTIISNQLPKPSKLFKVSENDLGAIRLSDKL